MLQAPWDHAGWLTVRGVPCRGLGAVGTVSGGRCRDCEGPSHVHSEEGTN